MTNKKIVMLAGEGDSTNIIYNAIDAEFFIDTVIIEKKESKKIFIKRRIKKLGIVTVGGQILFQLIIVKLLDIFSAKRIKNILAENQLNISDIPVRKIVRVNSINDNTVVELLRKIKPDVIIINGTRIISKKILTATPCVFINGHTGVTPMYRGVHGGYWALVNNDRKHCGVTVHLVDEGIDTGAILYQENIQATKKDNFVTYPYLQTAKMLSILSMAVENALSDNLNKVSVAGNSKIWYHPTIWQYLFYRIFKNVK